MCRYNENILVTECNFFSNFFQKSIICLLYPREPEREFNTYFYPFLPVRALEGTTSIQYNTCILNHLWVFFFQDELSYVRKQLEVISSELKGPNKTAEAYLSHPVNQFKLIRRFAQNWQHIQDSISLDYGNNDIASEIKSISDKVLETKSDEIAKGRRT